jgi:hypothetical protein
MAERRLIAQGLRLIPNFATDAKPFGVGFGVTFGGHALGEVAAYSADVVQNQADRLNYEAGMSSKIGSYARREQDWAFQSNLAAGEITQILKQIRAAQIREAVAEFELKSHRQQMKHAEEIERYLNEEGTEKTGKKTNRALYAWMKRELKALYSQAFQFAFDIAKKAERALQHELGNTRLNYLQFSYLSGKEGLLAGEKLYFDIKRMELAYHEQNRREYELTKHVSLMQVDPLALIDLRTTGSCTLKVPEALFDMDGPGHFFRRIKNVAVSIPCVTGPYAGVNCTLTLQNSSIRISSLVAEAYERALDGEDARFSDYSGSLQSIVTSSGQNDSGLFETNLRDERYLPFENSGVISTWRLQLSANPEAKEPTQFDYKTISDVILHIRYTAREGGSALRSAALSSLGDLISSGGAPGSTRLFSIRHEFPTEWAQFRNSSPNTDKDYLLTIELREEHYPFWSAGRAKQVLGHRVIPIPSDDSTVELSVSFEDPEPAAVGKCTIKSKSNELEELWLALAWKSDGS